MNERNWYFLEARELHFTLKTSQEWVKNLHLLLAAFVSEEAVFSPYSHGSWTVAHQGRVREQVEMRYGKN